MNEITDQQLLHEFAGRRTEAAFRELVRRHVDLVHSAAVRLAADPHLAEDVSQGVFAALAQQAGQVSLKLAGGAPLSAWLHVTTRNLAAKAVRSEVRRRLHEQEAAAMNESTPDASPWDQIAPHLDSALAELPEPDRDAVLLRFFERKTAREIGHHLGLSEEAAQKRVSRALERLRERFSARGVTVSSAALAGVLAANVIQTAPMALAAGIASEALSAGLVSTPAILTGLAAKLASTLAMTKTQTATLTALIAALGIPIAVQQSTLNDLRAARAAANSETPGASQIEAPAPPPSAPRETEAEEMARLRALAESLRNQIAAKRASSEPSNSAQQMKTGPTLIETGRRVPVEEFVFAGYATPEAALQSMHFFMREGDVDGFYGMTLIYPEQIERLRAMIADPEARNGLAKEWREEMQGVVMEEATQVDEDGNVIQQTARKKFPPNAPGKISIELNSKQELGERRVQLTFRTYRGDQGGEHGRLIFGLTSTGWKLVLN